MLLTYATDRLLMHVLNPSAAPMVLEFYLKNKESFSPFEPYHENAFYTVEYQAANLEAELKMFYNLRSIRYYLFLKQDLNHIIGTLSFTYIENRPSSSCRIGFRLDAAFRRKGYAYEAAQYMIPLVMKELRLNRIEANVLEDNHPSIRLLNRLGFTYEGIARGCYEIQGIRRDHLRFSLLDTDIFLSGENI